MIIIKNNKYTMKKEDNKYIIYRKNNKVQVVNAESDEKQLKFLINGIINNN